MINCKNCGATLKQDIAICKYCGSEYRSALNITHTTDMFDSAEDEGLYADEEDIEGYYSEFDEATISPQNSKPNLLDLYNSNFKYGPLSWCLWGFIRACLPEFVKSVPEIDEAYNDVLFFSHIGTPLYLIGALIFIFIVPALLSIIIYFFYGEKLTETIRLFKKALLVSLVVWIALYFCRIFMPDRTTNLSEHNSLLFSPIGGVLWVVRCFLFLIVFPAIATIIFYKKKFKTNLNA